MTVSSVTLCHRPSFDVSVLVKTTLAYFQDYNVRKVVFIYSAGLPLSGWQYLRHQKQDSVFV